ncbi:hypothetical protein CAAN1_23S01596 [[Candida] anglica]|uniref:Uncharacterized protein n=1 Tax=[Candida] anglica TaxID=148631 RepID=A0ABP0E9N6_9ASCO
MTRNPERSQSPYYSSSDDDNSSLEYSTSGDVSDKSSIIVYEEVPEQYYGVTSPYYDNEHSEEGSNLVFGPDVDRVLNHNSVILPTPRIQDLGMRKVTKYPTEFQKPISTSHPYTPFKSIVMVANSIQLQEGFPMVYFPEVLSSHDIMSTEWQKFLDEMKLAANPTLGSQYESNYPYLNRTSNVGQRRKKTSSISSLSSLIERRGRRDGRSNGAICSLFKVGTEYLTTRREREIGHPYYNTQAQRFANYERDIDYFDLNSIDTLSSVIHNWNVMFFNNRSINICLKLPSDVQADYDHASNAFGRRDARLVSTQLDQDGGDASFKKCRLVISSL